MGEIISVALAAAFSALGTAIVSHVKNGNRLTALEVRAQLTAAWLERVEQKLDRALEQRTEHRRGDDDDQPARR